MPPSPPTRAPVLIVGGGPCGLMLANELGRRGIGVVLVDEKPGTAVNAQANATQARTMEYFRRLGFADEIRALGMPADYPTDIAYYTRWAGCELARFALPSAAEAKKKISSLGGSWSAAELPHRISQKYVEAVIRRHAEALPGVSLHYGWRMASFTDHGDRVTAEVEPIDGGERATITADYLIGADGGRSPVRAALGIEYEGERQRLREFMGGRMYAVYLDAPRFYEDTGMAPAWMQVAFNTDRRAFMAAVDGVAEFVMHAQLKPGETEEGMDDARALAMFHAAAGVATPATVLTRGGWTAGYTLVAQRFSAGRVLLGGDAVHLFTPAGGLGYNTAVEDAVNLGWKLAAVLKGQAPPALLDSYEAERRPLAIRNTGYARALADIEDETPAGEAARAEAGAYFNVHARKEFDIPGITFGGRYDASPVIVGDGTAPPPDSANAYTPTACPGGRAPHIWLEDGRSLYDRFGFEWTLLRLGANPPAAAPLAAAAKTRGVELTVLDLPGDEARTLYAADLALIRPDQIVAWRGDRAPDAPRLWDQVLGGPI